VKTNSHSKVQGTYRVKVLWTEVNARCISTLAKEHPNLHSMFKYVLDENNKGYDGFGQ
jgi:hypothetical protein